MQILNIEEEELSAYTQTLSNININKSIIIISKFNNIEIDNHSFIIKTAFKEELKDHKLKFNPYIKISSPAQLYPNFKSLVNGLALLTYDVDEKREECKEFYYPIYYDKLYYYFEVYNPILFRQGLSVKNIIKENSPILSINFLYRFIDKDFSCYPKLGETYLINNSYLYDKFPNLGG